MDQKRAMLYPPLEPGNSTLMRDQRNSASAAMGLPIEAPPSYDMAMSYDPSCSGPSTSTASGCNPSLPQATAPEIVLQPQPEQRLQQPTRPSATAVVVEQPVAYQPQPTVPQPIIVQPTTPAKLGPHPCAVRCPSCGSCKTTRMCYTPNSRTHICALLLCLVGWCCCACCVPYCMKSCRTGNHYCSKCNTFLGSYTHKKIKSSN